MLTFSATVAEETRAREAGKKTYNALNLEVAQYALEMYLEKLDALQHCPIDDLESATWVFIWEVSLPGDGMCMHSMTSDSHPQSARCGTNLKGLHSLSDAGVKEEWISVSTQTREQVRACGATLRTHRCPALTRSWQLVSGFGLESEALKELLSAGLPWARFGRESLIATNPNPDPNLSRGPPAPPGLSLMRQADIEAFEDWDIAFERAIEKETAKVARAEAARAAAGVATDTAAAGGGAAAAAASRRSASANGEAEQRRAAC